MRERYPEVLLFYDSSFASIMFYKSLRFSTHCNYNFNDFPIKYRNFYSPHVKFDVKSNNCDLKIIFRNKHFYFDDFPSFTCQKKVFKTTSLNSNSYFKFVKSCDFIKNANGCFEYLCSLDNNGFPIHHKIDFDSLLVNLKIENNFLINSFITEFDQNYDIIRNIKSEKIDILNNEWLIYDAISFIGNTKINDDLIKLNSNFNYENIKKLFSNLSSLTIFELFNLKKNYSLLGYSVNEIDLYIYKLFSYPIYYLLMVILSSFIMFNSKKLGSNTFKISLGLFLSVIIYYINNLFYVFANSERIPLGISISLPLAILILFNFMISKRINEK